MQFHNFEGVDIAAMSTSGNPLESEQDALDIVGACYGHTVDWIAIPVSRLSPDLFDLSTRKLGAILQKFQNYSLKIAIIGDVSPHIEASNAFRDFVYEAQSGKSLRFSDDLETLRASFS